MTVPPPQSHLGDAVLVSFARSSLAYAVRHRTTSVELELNRLARCDVCYGTFWGASSVVERLIPTEQRRVRVRPLHQMQRLERGEYQNVTGSIPLRLTFWTSLSDPARVKRRPPTSEQPSRRHPPCHPNHGLHARSTAAPASPCIPGARLSSRSAIRHRLGVQSSDTLTCG